MPRLHRFYSELRRRRVFRVALAYGAVGWIVVEIAATTAPLLGLPTWAPTFVLILVLLGLPLALVLSWLFDVTPEGVRRTAAPAHSGGAPATEPARSPARWTAQRIAAVGGLVVLALAALALGTLRDRRSPSPFDASDEVMSAIAVMPFSVRGDARLAYLREGMVDLLSTDLDRPGGLRSVDAHAVLAATARNEDVSMAPELGRSVAERLAAGLFVLGSVVEVDGNVRVTASLYDRSRGARPVATRVVEGGVDEVLELVGQLAESLAAALPSPVAGGDPAVRLVWSDPRLDLLGSVSPDGRLVSFTDWETGDLALHDLTTGLDRRVTDKGSWADSDAFAEFSRFSPDGSRIAYAWFDADWRYGIRVVGVDGSDVRPLLTLGSRDGWCEPLGWSPDSRRVLARVFPSDSADAMLLWLDADGDAADTVLTLPRTDLGNAMPSPDDRWIAYDHAAEGPGPQRHLSLVTAGGRAVRRLATGIDIKVLAWTGDDGIILAMDVDGEPGVYHLSVHDGRAAGDPELLRARMHWLQPMGVVDSVLYYGITGSEVQSYVADIDLDAGEITSVPELAAHASAESSSWPVWSPDGRAAAYMADPFRGTPGSNRLVIRRLDDGTYREFELPLDRASIVDWAPDPTGIVVWGRRRDGTQYYRLDPESGELTVLLPWGAMSRLIAVVGGTAFVQKSPTPRITEVVRHDLVTGDEQMVATIEEGNMPLAVSADGSRLLVRHRDGVGARNQLLSVPAGGGEATVLHELSAGEQYHRAAWAPDGSSILFVRGRVGRDEHELWRLRLADGDARRILTRNGLRHIRPSPDGRRILFSAGEVHGELWALRGLGTDPPGR